MIKAPPPPHWTVVELDGRDGLKRLEADWRRLYAAMPQRTSFHAYEAHRAYADHIMEAPDRLRCLAISDGETIRAICVLEACVDRILGLPLRTWRVPLPSHLQWGDVIGPEDDARRAAIPAIVNHLRRDPMGLALLHLGPLPKDSSLWRGLRCLHRDQYRKAPSWSTDIIDCDQPLEQIASRLSKNFRANLRKAGNKLKRLPDVRFVTATEEADLRREFEAFLDVEASGWKGAAGTRTAIRYRKHQPAFFLDLLIQMRDGEDRGEIRALYTDGRCIASQLCTRTGSEYAILKTGYDEAFSRVSPGQLLCRTVIESACEDPCIARLDLVGDADWHRDWRPDSVELQTAYIAVDRWRGRLLIALLRLRIGPARRFARWLRGQLAHGPAQGTRGASGA